MSVISYARKGSEIGFLPIIALAGFALADSFAAIAAHNAFLGEEGALGGTSATEFTLADEDQPYGHQHKKQSDDDNGE